MNLDVKLRDFEDGTISHTDSFSRNFLGQVEMTELEAWMGGAKDMELSDKTISVIEAFEQVFRNARRKYEKMDIRTSLSVDGLIDILNESGLERPVAIEDNIIYTWHDDTWHPVVKVMDKDETLLVRGLKEMKS